MDYTKEWLNYRVHVKRFSKHCCFPVTVLAEQWGQAAPSWRVGTLHKNFIAIYVINTYTSISKPTYIT